MHVSGMDSPVSGAFQYAEHVGRGGDVSVKSVLHDTYGCAAGHGSPFGAGTDRSLHLPAVHVVEDDGRHMKHV